MSSSANQSGSQGERSDAVLRTAKPGHDGREADGEQEGTPRGSIGITFAWFWEAVMTMRAGLLATAVLAAMAQAAVAGPFEDAQAAHGRSDYATALRLWRPLADQGNAEAQYALGFMYDRGQGVPQNHAEAAKWWRLAADQGNTFAQYNLGALYDDGKGVPQNKAEALKWYHLAAERGNDRAQFNVGLLHFAGVAVPENRVEAAKWFRRAADQGHIGGQVYLGLSYATGLGVPPDNIHAYMWLSLPAARGDQDAISNRDRVARQMTPAQIAEAQKLAREWKPKPER